MHMRQRKGNRNATLLLKTWNNMQVSNNRLALFVIRRYMRQGKKSKYLLIVRERRGIICKMVLEN